MSIFSKLPHYSPDPILGLNEVFKEDKRKRKINLLLGVFLENNKNHMFSSVKEAFKALSKRNEPKSYLSILGLESYLREAQNIIFDGIEITGYISSVQALGGTGAITLGARLFFSATEGLGEVLIPNLTWPNHRKIFSSIGLNVKNYFYYDSERNIVNKDVFLDLEKAKENSLIVVQGCCYNPCGITFSNDQWEILSRVAKEKKFIVLFDMAYQGFQKSLKEDAWPIRYFLNNKIPLLIASSNSKNFSLYGERIGALFVVNYDAGEKEKIVNVIQEHVRSLYSSPPRFGAEVISLIMKEESLRRSWLTELNFLRETMNRKRKSFLKKLRKYSGNKFDFISEQSGFFGYLSMENEGVDFLREKKGIYVTSGGRFNLTSIADEDEDYVAESIVEAHAL